MSRRRKRSKNKASDLPLEPSIEDALELPENLADDVSPPSESVATPSLEHEDLVQDDALDDALDDEFSLNTSFEPTPIAQTPISRKTEPSAKKEVSAPKSASTEFHKSKPLTQNPTKARPSLQKAAPALKHSDQLIELDDTETIPVAPPVIADITAPSQAMANHPKEAEPEDTSPPESPPSKETTIEKPPTSISQLLLRFISKLTGFEKASLSFMTATLLALTIWGCQNFIGQLPKLANESELDFPLKGKRAVIADLKTFWRAPNRSANAADERIPEEIEIVPYFEIQLDPASTAGTLRFLFRDEKGNYAGDSTTLRFKKDQFSASDSPTAILKGNTAIVRATTGFERQGELISYTAEESFRWHLVIFETDTEEKDKFQELLVCPISPTRKDNP